MGAIDTFTHDLPKSIKSFDTGNNVPFTYEAYVFKSSYDTVVRKSNKMDILI